MKKTYDIKQAAKEQIAPYRKTLFYIAVLLFIISIACKYLRITYHEEPAQFLWFEYTSKKSINIGLWLLSPVFTLSSSIIYLNLTRGIEPKIKDIFVGFKDWWCIVKLSAVKGFFIACWTFVFIIPGVIKCFSYALAEYILAENKGMRACEAISISRALMTGHKMELFKLELSLLGFKLLQILTFGIASIWVGPYISAVYANFYRKVRGSKHKIKSIPIYD
ncbi:MAG: DUF975 family protein [Clostridia bacterium]|nr:DUF975 family protein [Clostridia bacterium]